MPFDFPNAPTLNQEVTGAAGEIYQWDGVKWVAIAKAILTTKGDIHVFSTQDARLPVGTDGQALTASSAAATGLAWETPAAGGVTSFNTRTGAVMPASGDYTVSQVTGAMSNPFSATGDMVYQGSAGGPSRLAVGTSGQVLTVVSGIPAWATPAGGGAVSSVFGRTGAVVAATGDYTVAQVTNAVPNTTQVIAGNGLSGGGALTGNVTLQVQIAQVQTPWLANINANGYGVIGLQSINSGGSYDLGIGNSGVTPPDANTANIQLIVGPTGSGTTWGEVSAVGNTTTNGAAIGYLNFANYAISVAEKRIAYIGSYLDGASNSGNLVFYTFNAGSANERMRITSGGNVGIGTSSPGTTLDVIGVASGDVLTIRSPIAANGDGPGILFNQNTGSNLKARIQAPYNSTTNGMALTFSTFDGSSVAERVRIASGGNVGIGTSSPVATIHGNAGAANYNPSLTYGSACAFLLYNAGVELAMGVSSTPPYPFWMQSRLNNNTGQALALNPLGGNVGIGTTSPLGILDVESGVGGAGYCYFRSNVGGALPSGAGNSAGRLALGWNYTSGNAEVDFFNTFVGPGGFNFYSMPSASSATLLMTITGAGNVGIGTSSPWATFTVNSANTGSPSLTWNSICTCSFTSGGGGELAFGWQASTPYPYWIQSRGGSSSANPLGINPMGGAVGIGCLPSGSYTLQLSIDSAAKPSTNTWTIASGAAVKRNVRPLEGGLAIINQIRPVEAEYNGALGTPLGQRVVSVIAEEIRKILPHTVTEAEPGNLGFNSHEILFHLILAVQQLSQLSKKEN